MGFVLNPEEAKILIEENPENQDVIFPYLSGQDLNSRPNQFPSRYVINFFDWPLDADNEDPKNPKGKPYASDYPDCLKLIIARVKEERESLPPSNHFNKSAAKKWWQYGGPRIELYNSLKGLERVLVRARVANIHSMVVVPNGWVYNEKVVAFPQCSFPLLQSNIHEVWAREYSSSLRKDMQYTPSNCFETFPFPESTDSLEVIGERYHTHRQTIMQTRQEGLTKIYNRFHDPTCTDPDIQTLRDLHIQMDSAVATAYGWHDLTLNHDFHETKQGLRFTISEAARREVLDRLLELNHQRYAEEVAQGLHDKKKGKGKKGKQKKQAPKETQQQSDSVQGSLF
jgi:hypothetical protein